MQTQLRRHDQVLATFAGFLLLLLELGRLEIMMVGGRGRAAALLLPAGLDAPLELFGSQRGNVHQGFLQVEVVTDCSA